MKNYAQQACNPHFTPRLEFIEEDDLKAKEVSKGSGGKKCNSAGSVMWDQQSGRMTEQLRIC